MEEQPKIYSRSEMDAMCENNELIDQAWYLWYRTEEHQKSHKAAFGRGKQIIEEFFLKRLIVNMICI